MPLLIQMLVIMPLRLSIPFAKDYEENPRVSEAWVYLGMLRLLVKRLAKAP